jgi:hypothetical protein
MFEIYILQKSGDPAWQMLAEFPTLAEATGVASMALGKFKLWCVRVLPAEKTLGRTVEGAVGREIERDDPYWVRYESRLAQERADA